MWENLYLWMMDLRKNFEVLQNQWEEIGYEVFTVKGNGYEWVQLTLSSILLKNGQTYFKNLMV